MGHDLRDKQWSTFEETVFDVAIIGGGVNGAAIYHELCRRGASVCLVDKGDFAGATSQASARLLSRGRRWTRVTLAACPADTESTVTTDCPGSVSTEES